MIYSCTVYLSWDSEFLDPYSRLVDPQKQIQQQKNKKSVIIQIKYMNKVNTLCLLFLQWEDWLLYVTVNTPVAEQNKNI